jgi:predicted O-linked N-acetylglucosamine transferase (SPINDLY family)
VQRSVSQSQDLLLGRAIAALQAGRIGEAESLYKLVLQVDKSQFDALHMLGIIEAQRGNLVAGQRLLNEALRVRPDAVDALINFGRMQSELGDSAGALATYNKALALDPRSALMHNNVSIILRHQRQFEQALTHCDSAINLAPDYAAAWNNRGNALFELDRLEEALESYNRALALQPQLGESHLGRGNVLSRLHRHDDAIVAFAHALTVMPNFAEAWLACGDACYALRHYNEALKAFDKAIALKADLADAWLGRGNVLGIMRRHSDALVAYDRALALKGDLAEASMGRGNVLGMAKRYDDALANLDRALTLKPNLAEAWHDRGLILLEIGRVAEALVAFDKALSIKPAFSEAITGRIFALDFLPDAGFEQQQKARNDWWLRVGSSIAEQSRLLHSNTPDQTRRIKIGYVSGDFHRHSAALCFKPVLLNHNKTEFEITCYSTSQIADELTQIFRSTADRWRDVFQLPDDEFCKQIQADQIDILVDLSGHSTGNRLGVFARKPAPIQVTAWGHATGTGLPTIDYLFSDPIACPLAVRSMFTEKIYDLPCLISIDPVPDDVRPVDPPTLSNGYLTFGVFNRASKISEATVSLWARILDALPSSQMLMKNSAFDEQTTRSALLAKFGTHGIAEDRIGFLGATSRRDHLDAFGRVDISLDPFPQNGGISTWESLQMGVPVVGLLGNSIASRLTGSILSAVGLCDWVAESLDHYLTVAVEFASMPEHLKALRLELPARIMASQAGNSAAYTRAVEAAYRKLWADYCQNATAGVRSV